MATVTFIKYAKQSAGALGGVAAYVAQTNKTMQENGRQLVSGQNCTPPLAVREFLTTRAMHRKESPVWFYHYVQSFAPSEPVTGELAHEIAKLFAAKAWPESEVLIATHIDREHIHSHFIVNSVCYGSGKMLRQGPGTLARLRPISDELCAAHGLSVLPRQETKTQGLGAREYRSATKGESWKFRLMNTIDECMKYAADRDAFVSLMESEGYTVRWESGRKYITYTTPDGMKCRDNKLYEEKYCKEAMEREFRIRAEVVSARTQAAQLPADSAAGTGTTSRSAPLKSGLGANDERSGYTVVPCGSADGSVGAHQQADVAASHTDAAGRSAEDGTASGADERTGWETERKLFFSAQNQTSQAASTTSQYSGIDLSANGGGSTASALVGLGHRLEQLRPAAPVMPIQHYTDRKALQKEREKKIALGHKADDHEDEVSYDWQQTM
ncbi:relaxase/mobilization nuclease domain-containing protein [Intestinimonas butyriciproducens]|uniref:relaxase/mobilization nuclease domain-containing protein n=1 Tax=Intestinimonas butyriciproducens TaxID=1297617 RepID=UPI00189D71E4|nr:relaxase/mobilization nuclease domain-containing protein [Intestinimonas butyriciproducens]